MPPIFYCKGYQVPILIPSSLCAPKAYLKLMIYCTPLPPKKLVLICLFIWYLLTAFLSDTCAVSVFLQLKVGSGGWGYPSDSIKDLVLLLRHSLRLQVVHQNSERQKGLHLHSYQE